MGRSCSMEEVDREEVLISSSSERGETVAKQGSRGRHSWLGVRQSLPLNWPLKAVTRAHRETGRPPRQPQSPLRLTLATLLHVPLVWCSPLVLGRSLPQCWLFSWASEPSI